MYQSWKLEDESQIQIKNFPKLFLDVFLRDKKLKMKKGKNNKDN